MVAMNQIQKHLTMAEALEELTRLKDIGLPISAINLAYYIKSMISVALLGRIGRLELAGGALAVGFTNITGYSVLSGLALGMEPISSQAFGSRNLPLLFSVLRRTILLLLVASLPISLLWLNLRPILTLLRQDSDVATVAARYCLFSLPDLIANSLLHPIRIHLRSQNNPLPIMYSSFIATTLHLPLSFFLTKKLGVAGVAIAAFCTNFNTLLFLFAYTTINRLKTTPSKKIAPLFAPLLTPSNTSPPAEWGTLLKLAFPSCLAVCLEWWWYELMTLTSGYLKNPRVTLATSAIVIQTTSLMYTLPTTLSAVAAARVGNEIGAGQPQKARLAAVTAMTLAVAGSCMSLTWATLGREAWARVFTEDNEVLALTKAVLPVIGLCELANCPQTTGCGVLRGSARPAIGAAINLYSFYLVGAPVAAVLAFGLDLGFVGLCLGLLTAQLACAISVVIVTWRTDWEEEATRAVDLVGRRDDEAEMAKGGSRTMERGEEGGVLKEVVVFEK